MGHELIRATIIPDIIKLIEEEYHVTENAALNMFYTSNTGKNYANDETGLYGQSALFVFSLFKEEQK